MKRKAPIGDRKRHEVLSRMLLDRHNEIQNRLRVLRELIPAEATDVKDAEEQSMEDFVRDMDVALMEMQSETLRRIDEALLRVKEGTYGICASCEGTIAEARLQALPFATLCRDCQEREEEDATIMRAGGRRSAYQEPPPREEKASRQRGVLPELAIPRSIRIARARA